MKAELEHEAIFLRVRIMALHRLITAINREINVLETRIEDIRRRERQINETGQ